MPSVILYWPTLSLIELKIGHKINIDVSILAKTKDLPRMEEKNVFIIVYKEAHEKSTKKNL